MRPPSSVAIATLKPSPTSPTTALVRAPCTFSKNTVHECAAWMPSLWSGGACVKPGVPFGDEERGVLDLVAPVRLGDGEDEDVVGVRAVGDPVLRAVEDPAVVAVFSAMVTIVCASEPLIGSVRPKQPSFLPEAHGARISFFCCVGAELVERVAEERVVHAHDDAGRRARRADLLHHERVGERVEAGAAVLLRDRHARGSRARPSCATISAGQRPLLSISAALGAISRAAKSRAVSRTSRCSSVRSKSIAPVLDPAVSWVELIKRLEHAEAGDLAGPIDQPRLWANRHRNARRAKQRNVEGVVPECGVNWALRPDSFAETRHLAFSVRDRALDGGLNDRALVACLARRNDLTPVRSRRYGQPARRSQTATRSR